MTPVQPKSWLMRKQEIVLLNVDLRLRIFFSSSPMKYFGYPNLSLTNSFKCWTFRIKVWSNFPMQMCSAALCSCRRFLMLKKSRTLKRQPFHIRLNMWTICIIILHSCFITTRIHWLHCMVKYPRIHCPPQYYLHQNYSKIKI